MENRPATVLVVVSDPLLRRRIVDALSTRADLSVQAEQDPSAALGRITEEKVDLLVADQWLAGITGAELAVRAAKMCAGGIGTVLLRATDPLAAGVIDALDVILEEVPPDEELVACVLGLLRRVGVRPPKRSGVIRAARSPAEDGIDRAAGDDD